VVTGCGRSDRRRLRRQCHAVAYGIDTVDPVLEDCGPAHAAQPCPCRLFDLDLDGETDRLVALGAKVVEKFELPPVCYTAMTDPVGHRFESHKELNERVGSDGDCHHYPSRVSHSILRSFPHLIEDFGS